MFNQGGSLPRFAYIRRSRQIELGLWADKVFSQAPLGHSSEVPHSIIPYAMEMAPAIYTVAFPN